MDVSVFFFGLFLGFFIFTMECVIRQTIHIWKRTRNFTQVYLWMIWLESFVNLLFASTTPYFITAVALWALQTQLLSQIIANRIALIMVSKRKSHQLRWSLFIAIALVNLAVAFIWIPAHLNNATAFRQKLNFIFENVEKSFFLLVDLGLNLYFLYLVRYRLIAEGLSKYWTLYKFNVGFVAISTVMDGLLLGLLNLPDQFAYVQFAPVTYTVKLYLELQMAQLISKVVRRNVNRVDGLGSSSHGASGIRPHLPQTQTQTYHAFAWSRKKPHSRNGHQGYDLESQPVRSYVDVSTGEPLYKHGKESDELKALPQGQNIVKTVTTVVRSETQDNAPGVISEGAGMPK
ncbi:hypothetical protein BDV06DRAFT_225489 [Aspergillus oleicola]